MKGLLIKDTQLVMLNKKIVVMFLVVACIMMVTTDFGNNAQGSSFVIGYFTFMFGTFVLSTITYDESDHSIAYLFTMPVSRTTYVREKYVFCLLGTLGGWVLSILVALSRSIFTGITLDVGAWAVSCLAILIVLCWIMLLLIPVQIKFGGDNGRSVVAGILIVVFLVAIGGKKLCDYLHIDIVAAVDRGISAIRVFPVWAVALAILAFSAILTAISMKVSEHIVNHKEY